MSDSINQRQIQWFPGHMTKTLRLIGTELRHVDAVVVLLDARIPASSLNPELEKLIAAKPRLYILNKSDLADPAITKQWVAHFRGEQSSCIAISSKSRGAVGSTKAEINRALAPLLQRREQKGTSGAAIRLMLVGIPNVGKSTFINSFTGSARAKTADRPGVTRGKQWVSVTGYDLLDMPGVLWKKFEDQKVAINLAFIGSIKDDILDMEEIAGELLCEVKQLYPKRLQERYKLTEDQLQKDRYDLLAEIGKNRGMRIAGGEIDLERAAITVVDEFRASKLGSISLERPVQSEPEAEA